MYVHNRVCSGIFYEALFSKIDSFDLFSLFFFSLSFLTASVECIMSLFGKCFSPPKLLSLFSAEGCYGSPSISISSPVFSISIVFIASENRKRSGKEAFLPHLYIVNVREEDNQSSIRLEIGTFFLSTRDWLTETWVQAGAFFCFVSTSVKKAGPGEIDYCGQCLSGIDWSSCGRRNRLISVMNCH